ncbi:L-ascorbate metabolism protein UlaG (beta-lactamase superfamily) [Sporomusaceae bacterium BoRhaA]|uniref:MBL fold metallo-hydrolase n=1 Tax=Pelorhabdus rhamnosifermentans TaxID=2772457 RepID=UPI001FE4CA08|nr:MBL fold metallo-hydrolase [Pelorhabdus rhamnosifermentans]MBU2703720.1 L-ascorbate metabolism protein UlaG (beta-lactamase superfamily) [Pelorhabdus rhamnosifermentans]
MSDTIGKKKFINEIATSMYMGPKTMFTMLRDFIKANPKRTPDKPIPINFIDTLPLQDVNQTKVIWFGHSTVLLEMEGKRVLLDPMFSNSPSPFSLFGGKRFSKVLPIEMKKLPPIDIVILSHDHYDHLDYNSIMQLRDKTRLFCVPNGVGIRLKKWGIDQEKIREFDWWNELIVQGLTLACTPARHFSGRSLFDRNTTLWCSWVITGKQTRVFFSGDGGYGPHFEQIGKKYGPFDLTLMECGQYDARWSAIHMLPEETIQAHIDVRGHSMIPIHWAAFSLAFHDWTEPIERVTKMAKERKVNIVTPKIGEFVIVGSAEYPKSVWWK